MPAIEGITENLRFMVNEVTTQVDYTLQFFTEPTRNLVEKITARDNYVDNLKSVILEKTYSVLGSEQIHDKSKIILLRSLSTIATNLERIADFSVNMLRQAEHLTDVSFTKNFEMQPFFEEVLAGLERIEPALRRRDISMAFRICQCEFNLDELYGSNFKIILENLSSDGNTGNLVTTLMILHYLERMGDSLLNIGEAVIFVLVGENLKIEQYRGLKDSLDASGLETPISEVEFQSIWGTRSGCRIGLVGDRVQTDARPVLFKHGEFKKLVKERENIRQWEDLHPGLPPQVCGFVEGDDGDGSILLEYIPGSNFQDLMLSGDETAMREAQKTIKETVSDAWRRTMKRESVHADFIRQLRDRMEAVYRIHPQFQGVPAQIGGLKIPSFGELLNGLKSVEDQLAAPFSVFIHGDFNINNIIFNAGTGKIHFIDLHRSAQTDYIQDVSVFLISIFRLPVFERQLRGRLNWSIMDFFEFSKQFAEEFDDATFEARLAFGLARSFFSSTRFELNRKFARKMHLLSVYLFQKLRAHQGQPWEDFELPGETLIY
jgi:phosphate uptake regulator